MDEVSAGARHRLFAELVARPGIRVAALGFDGLCRPAPAELPVSAVADFGGAASALELVAPGDVLSVIEAWTAARATGHSMVTIRLAAAPHVDCLLHLMDLTDRYGVYVAVLVGAPRGVDLRRRDGDDCLRPRMGVIRKDDLATVVEADAAILRILGWQERELVGRRSLDLTHPDDQPRAIATWVDMLARPGVSRRVRLRQLRADGRWMWFEITNHNLLQDPNYRCVLSEMLDISEEMAAQEKLRSSEALLRRLTEVLPVGVVHVDTSGEVLYRNDRVQHVLGRQIVLGLPLIEQVAPGGDFVAALTRHLPEVLRDGADRDVEITESTPHGLRRLHVTLRALVCEGVITGAVACVNDITEVVRMLDELEQRATYDDLTGCLTRQATLDRLERMIEARVPVSTYFLDLDGFKDVNDRHGHAVGDALLRHVGTCLTTFAASGDVVGRLGGDEFLLATVRPTDDEEAAALADELARVISTPVLVDGTKLAARASVGMVRSLSALDADELIAGADLAMYEVKARHRSAARR